MDTHTVAFNVIKNVITSKYDLKTSLKVETEELTRKESIEVSQICGLFFRNYFLIEHLAESLNFPKNSDEFIELGLLYVNNALRQRVDSNKMFNDFLMKIIQAKYQFSKEQIFFIKEVISKKRTFEFFNIKKGSLKYYSIRFNKPEWFIKLITKQFGRKDGLSILYEISAMPQQFVSVGFNKSFSPTNNYRKISSELYEFTSPTSIRKEDTFYNGNIYLTQLGYQELISKIDANKEEVTCLLNDENTIAYDFLKRFINKENKINFVSNKKDLTEKIFETINSFKEENVKTIFTEENDLSKVLKKKQKIILYSPFSSNFELFRRNPEYGVYFKADVLDKIVSNINLSLNEIIKWLKKDGTLIYMVPTINLNETRYLISKFIEKNNFDLIEEKLFLPNKEGNSLLYYAIIRRKK